MDIELKPCPFCGNTSALRIVSSSENDDDEEYDFSDYETYAIVCDASKSFGKGPGGCGGSGGYKDTEEKAAEAWNTRV